MHSVNTPPILEKQNAGDKIETLVNAIFYSQTDTTARAERNARYDANNPNAPLEKRQSTHNHMECATIAQGLQRLNTKFGKKLSEFNEKTEQEIIDKIRQQATTLYNAINPPSFPFSKIDILLDLVSMALALPQKHEKKPKEALLLSWLAAQDTEADSFTEICGVNDNVQAKAANRVSLFINNLNARINENICPDGKYNAYYESIAGLHSHAPNILDIAAAKSLILKVYNEAMQDYLENHWNIKLIGQWTEGDILVERDEILELMDSKLRSLGYTKPVEIYTFADKKPNEQANELGGQQASKQLSKNTYLSGLFSVYPLFLSKLTEFEIFFTDNFLYDAPFYKSDEPNLHGYYRTVIQETRKALVSQLISYFNFDINNWPIEWQRAMQIAFYDIADAMLTHKKIECVFNEKKQLTASAYYAILDIILADEIPSELNALLMENLKASEKLNNNINDNHLLILQINHALKSSNFNDAITHLKEINPQDARYVMWMLCRLYKKAVSSKANSLAENILKIIVCMKQQGIYLEDCYVGKQCAVDFILKSNNEEARYLTLSHETLLKHKKFTKITRLQALATNNDSRILKAMISFSEGSAAIEYLIFETKIIQGILLKLANLFLKIKTDRERENKQLELINEYNNKKFIKQDLRRHDRFLRNAGHSHFTSDLKTATQPLIKFIYKTIDVSEKQFKKDVFFSYHLITIVKHSAEFFILLGQSITSSIKAPRKSFVLGLQSISMLFCIAAEIITFPLHFILVIPILKAIIKSSVDFYHTSRNDFLRPADALQQLKTSSSQKELNQYFNKAQDIHQQYKEQSLKLSSHSMLKKEREKTAWQQVKATFFAYKKTPSQADSAKLALVHYASQFTA